MRAYGHPVERHWRETRLSRCDRAGDADLQLQRVIKRDIVGEEGRGRFDVREVPVQRRSRRRLRGRSVWNRGIWGGNRGNLREPMARRAGPTVARPPRVPPDSMCGSTRVSATSRPTPPLILLASPLGSCVTRAELFSHFPGVIRASRLQARDCDAGSETGRKKWQRAPSISLVQRPHC